ncbi:MAG: hypothetical protein ACRDOK_22365 [Streptosporangiaceae bacterium]
MTAHPDPNSSAGSGTGQPPGVRRACQCHRCAESAAHRSDTGEELNAYIEELAERSPPLTGEQRDTLALLLSAAQRRSTSPARAGRAAVGHDDGRKCA